MAEARFGLPDPFSCAELVVRLVADAVAAVGADGVMKDWTEPTTWPPEFWTIAQK